MRHFFTPALFGLALLTTPATAQRRPAPIPVRQLADDVSQQSLRAMVERLVSFGTRHTLSSQTDPKRGIGASLRWTEAEFRRYARACGGCIQIATPSDTVTGRRVPTPTLVKNVFAIQRGTSEPNRVVIISGHIDSRVSDVLDAAKDAPGANDDGSGTAAVIEAARVLSSHKFPATIVYAVLSGEEQGLLGGKIMADYAKAQGWQVIANLNNDIIGNSCGSDGKCDADHVRIFSEGPRWQGREDLAARQRSLGGENDSPSRNLSRWLATLADDLSLGLQVRQIWRNDRFGRGGDHTEMLNAGYPAVRFSVAVEDYDHQHQDLRVENETKYGDTIDEMDFAYLTRVTQLNVAALAALARAPMPPEPTVEGAVQTYTELMWQPMPDAKEYVVRWRATDAGDWTNSLRLGEVIIVQSCRLPGNNECTRRIGKVVATLPGVRVDDYVFGVSSVSADGHESPVASAVPGGAFRPYTPPPPPAQP
ncbi:MAG TPA: M28 family peptidase [Allosphingosinicella sp.]|jgi:hypothetical protein